MNWMKQNQRRKRQCYKQGLILLVEWGILITKKLKTKPYIEKCYDGIYRLWNCGVWFWCHHRTLNSVRVSCMALSTHQAPKILILLEVMLWTRGGTTLEQKDHHWKGSSWNETIALLQYPWGKRKQYWIRWLRRLAMHDNHACELLKTLRWIKPCRSLTQGLNESNQRGKQGSQGAKTKEGDKRLEND